jgi:uncharacterized protein (TIGR00297 family)
MTPMLNLPQIVLGAALALAVVIAAVFFRALTFSGAAAAFLVGTVMFGLGGLPWAGLLLTFFVSSSALSLLFNQHSKERQGIIEKGSWRDAAQVLANGGLAGLMAILHWFFPSSILPWLAGAAALAAANADTWATELGMLSSKGPVLITNGRKVAPGTSGGISRAGTLAAIAGALLIAAVFFAFSPGQATSLANQTRWGLSVVIALSGWVGSLVDSLLGATLQAVYYCPSCQKETEKHPLHDCGTPTHWVRGWRWLNNDWVNVACTLAAAVLAIGIGLIF